jgi:hypothetical protein
LGEKAVNKYHALAKIIAKITASDQSEGIRISAVMLMSDIPTR